MSVQAMSWVFDHSDAAPSDGRLVLLTLANHLNGETGLCCPGIDLLAAETRMSHSAVWRAVQRLEDAKHIEVVRAKGRGNRYRIVGYDRAQGNQARDAPTSGLDQARDAPQPGAITALTRRASAPLTSNRNYPITSASQETRKIAEALALPAPVIESPDVDMHHADPDEQARVRAGPIAAARARVGLDPTPKGTPTDGDQRV